MTGKCGQHNAPFVAVFVMPGQKRAARLRARCPGHPRLNGAAARKTWMAGTSPAMTDMRMLVRTANSAKGSPALLLVAGSAGFLDELVDQGLTDPARDVLVDRLHRPAPLGLPPRRPGDYFGLAALLDRRERVFVFLARLPVAESGGFLHHLFELGANVGRQAVPEFFV